MEILYKDRHIAVCVKPVGVISEDAGMPALLREQLGGEAYCVHRLDTVVGGVMGYALSKKAASQLSAYVAGDMFTKEYLAVVEGIPMEEMVDHSFYEVFKNGDRKWLVSYADVALNGAKHVLHDYSPEIDKNLTIYCYQSEPGFCSCILVPEES